MDTSAELNRNSLPVRRVSPRVPTSVARKGDEKAQNTFVPLRPPPGAPNVVLVLIDDMGFGAPSTFGGPITMPTSDRLAAGGLAYTRFHTTGICSPTRQALLTGRNHHSVGMGLTPEIATDAPGYNSIRPETASTVATILLLNGYSTGAFGKMHQTPAWETSPAGPFDRWPTGEGFEHFYGFVAGEAHQYYPLLHRGTEPVDPPGRPEEGYHLSEDLVDQAIAWIGRQQSITPDKPFFCYLSFGACHAPLQVRPEWIDPYRGKFDHGWNRQREITLERQREFGIVPPDAQLGPWPEECPTWDNRTDREREAACRLMELYAGFATHTDAQVGRLVTAMEQQDLLDNTLFIYILGDNGASAEGGINGTTNEFATINGFTDSAEDILAIGARLGAPDTAAHYPAGWALAMDTPYQWTKQVASHYGGTRNGMAIHWPAGISASGELRHQWHHCIDITPTILEAAGLPAPHSVNGIDQMPMEGTSLLYTFDKGDAEDRHRTQYFEIFGNRGIYHEGWVACARHRTPWAMIGAVIPKFESDTWELYDTNSDWTQAADLAATRPDKLRELKDLFLVEAARHQVLPLDGRLSELFLPEIAGRYSAAGKRTSVTYPGTTRQLPEDIVLNVRNRSHRITAAVNVSDAGTGVIASQGGAFGGWALYLKDGCLTYCNNVIGKYVQHVRSNEKVALGECILEINFMYDGGGFGRGGLVELIRDGKTLASERIERTTPFTFSVMDKFHAGVNLGSPVSTDYPAIDNRFPGRVDWVRIETADDFATESTADRVRVNLASH